MGTDLRERVRSGLSLRRKSVVLGTIVALGAVLRLWHLGSPPLNFDESFTAMVGRLPLGTVFGFLRAHDSHPPLDYLLQLPLARAGVSPFWFRLPSVVCSVAALGLFAWWMRDHGRAGLIATAAMAVCAFQLTYAREARMYGVMELVGVAVAVVADAWLRHPRRRHAAIVGALVFVGLLTHVSMLLAVVGLLAIAGVRRDADAWRWRAAIAIGTAGWAALWGPSFLVQSGGGHSSWIPHTTAIRLIDTISRLVTLESGIGILVVAALVFGFVMCRRQDNTLATVLMCCFVVPVALAGIIGLRAPVLLDRTFAVVAWAPLLALGYCVDALIQRARTAGLVAIAVVLIAMLPTAAQSIAAPTGPTAALRELEKVARPGDVLAVQPVAKGVELDWTLGIRSDDGPTRTVQLSGLRQTAAIALTGHAPTGRIWLMQYQAKRINLRGYRRCARTWRHGPSRLICIERKRSSFAAGPEPSILAIYDHVARPSQRLRRA